VVVVAAAFAREVAHNTSDLRDVDLHLRPGWLVAALPVAIVAGPLLPLAWRRVLLAAGHDVAPRPAIRVWYLGQTARYLPTGLVAFASRAALVARMGVPRVVTVASVTVELLLIVTVGGGMAAAFLPSSELSLALRLAIALGCAAALALGPLLLRWASRRIRVLDPHGSGGWDTRGLYRAELAFLLNSAVTSAAFVLFAAAVLPVRAGDVWLLVGAVNAAATLGTLGITPAGLGVREGILAALLADRFGLGSGAALAVAARVWDTAVELAWLGLVHHRSFASSTVDPAPEPAS
jgi:hypothetical protein